MSHSEADPFDVTPSKPQRGESTAKSEMLSPSVAPSTPPRAPVNPDELADEVDRSYARAAAEGGGGGGGGGGNHDVNPFEVLERCKERLAERETLGPLTVPDDLHNTSQASSGGGGGGGGIMSQIRGRMTAEGRREAKHAREVERIHMSIPQLTMLMVVRLQRTWRGYIVRKNMEMVRNCGGGGLADLQARRVIQSAIYFGRSSGQRCIETDAGAAFRQLPLSFLGASAMIIDDTSPYRVSKYNFLWHYSVTSGGCGGVGLVFILIWHLLTTAATWLIPGWVAMVIKTIFYDGESSVEVNQLVGWVVVFSLICAIGVGFLRVMLVAESERFGHKLDFVLSVLGMKKSKLITMPQLQEMRSVDLGLAKCAVYRNGPLALLHGLHAFISMCAVFSFDMQLGCICLLALMAQLLVGSMYDQLVAAQSAILAAVSRREGAMRAYTTRKGIADREYTSRNYQLALSKTLLRMTQTYSRTHALVLATVIMLIMATTVFFLYAGAHRVKKDIISMHSFILGICYFFFAQLSYYRFNENLTAYLQANTSMQRLFKTVWHFRDFSDQQTFQEKECAIVAQASNMKEYRRQPKSIDLGVIVGIFVFLLVVWLAYFGAEHGEFTCEAEKIRCTASEDSMYLYDSSTTLMEFGFDFFYGCGLKQARSRLLKTCATASLNSGLARFNPAFATNRTYLTQLSYRGWRNDQRAFSKMMTTSPLTPNKDDPTQQPAHHACPSNASRYPFRTERLLYPIPRSGIAEGDVYGIKMENLRQVFFSQNNFRNCWADLDYPSGPLCENVEGKTATRQCWCLLGGTTLTEPPNFNDPRCDAIFARVSTPQPATTPQPPTPSPPPTPTISLVVP